MNKLKDLNKKEYNTFYVCLNCYNDFDGEQVDREGVLKRELLTGNVWPEK